MFRPTGLEALTSKRSKTASLIGLLPGEGVGPELIGLCRRLIESLNAHLQEPIELRTGGMIGLQAKEIGGKELSEEVIEFCRQIFADGGAILAGPGGGRFVYESRRVFDLFVKMNPLLVFPQLGKANCLRCPMDPAPDIMVVRDNCQGLYQGRDACSADGTTVRHTIEHSYQGVMRLLKHAFDVASRRSGKLCVIGKVGGIAQTTQLWHDCARELSVDYKIELRFLDIDFASYQMLKHPEEFDVIAVPNGFGDILSDIGGLLMGSRGNTFGASFDPQGNGIYQTNHGSAYDLVDTDKVNPAGQVLSLTMLLRESLGLGTAADALEQALLEIWESGQVTQDLIHPNATVIGTAAFSEQLMDRFVHHLKGKEMEHETVATRH